MTTSKSKASIRREEKRLSVEMQAFKQQILDFLQNNGADLDVQYHMVKDLAKMTSMPFYGDSNRGTKNRKPTNEVIKAYCRLLICYYKKTSDMEFARKLLSWLSMQQQQHLRKLTPLPIAQKHKYKAAKSAGQVCVYEHPIPVNYTKNLLLKYIEECDQQRIDAYIDFVFYNTRQVCMEKTWDDQVNRLYKDTMPDNWNWKDPENNDVYARYVSAGIPACVYA